MRFVRLSAASIALAIPAAASAQPPAQTIQQQFDAAGAARLAGNWAEALRLYEALESRARNARTLALVRVRKGTVLIELGRLDEAAAAIRQGLPGLPADEPTLMMDRFQGALTLGRVAEHALDYPDALAHYRLAAAIPVPEADRLAARRGIIQTAMFTDAEAALREADEALRLAAAASLESRPLSGQLHTLRGRVLLNLGRYGEARRALDLAQRLLGGLTDSVDRADLIARSDLAIAALLSRRTDDARRYLAYTGAGRFERGFIRLVSTPELAPCSAEIGPDDVAVIELFVGADGDVLGAMPIYASRQGPSAIALARAATSWTFDAEGAREVPALFRSVVRLEVRCSKMPEGDRYNDDVSTALERLASLDPAWERTVARRPSRSADMLRAALAQQELGPRAPRETLPLLLLLGDAGGVPRPEREAFLRRALPMAVSLRLPADLIAKIAMAIASEQVMQLPYDQREAAADYEALLVLPELRASAEASAYVRLAAARRDYHRGNFDEAATAAAAIRALPEARPGGPLVIQALEVEAAVQAARGDMAAARAAREAQGPHAPRCGLEPRRRRSRATSGDFPDSALRWGFEGWGRSEIMAAADGGSVEARTVAAYPPFVFGAAALEIAQRNRYEPVYPPDGEPCPAGTQMVVFRLPT